MSAPAIGGKVLDASALVAVVRHRLAALTWIDVARSAGIVLDVPTLAIAEVRALRQDAGPDLADLLGHSWVVLGDLDTATVVGVDGLLAHASAADTSGTVGVEVVDVLAAHVVHAATTRGWPVLTTDPARLRRLEPTVEIELL